jgi:lysozyme
MAASSNPDLSFYKTELKDPRVQAILDAITFAEGTWDSKNKKRIYDMGFGGTRFNSLDKHPDTVYKGRSTAAGAYQFLTPTWNNAANTFGFKDFKPEAQDIAALLLLRERSKDEGGINLYKQKGLTPETIALLAGEWASFPKLNGQSAYSNQSVKKADDIINFFKEREAYYKNNKPDNSQSGQANNVPTQQPASSPATAEQIVNINLGGLIKSKQNEDDKDEDEDGVFNVDKFLSAYIGNMLKSPTLESNPWSLDEMSIG